MIVHIPHASKEVPGQVRNQIVLSEDELDAELLRMTDAFTDQLFAIPDSIPIVYPISRCVVDPERFHSDAKEPMAKVGMGAVYTKTSDGKLLRQALTDVQRDELLNKYYWPHHHMLEKSVEEELQQQGSALILDCHSFPSTPLLCDLDQSTDRPAFCLGTDSYHTPPSLEEQLSNVIRAAGNSLGLNRPYTGTLVPLKYYQKDPRVRSIMIEVRRDLYMDETTGEKTPRFDELRAFLEVLVKVALNFR